MERKLRQVFVRNLAFDATEKDLEDLFAEVGPVKRCSVVKGKDGASRGFGFVKFSLEEDAQRAVERLNGYVLNGRKVQLDIAVTKGTNPTKDDEESQPREGASQKRKPEVQAEAEVEVEVEATKQPQEEKSPEPAAAEQKSKSKKRKVQPTATAAPAAPAPAEEAAAEIATDAAGETSTFVAKRDSRKRKPKGTNKAQRTVLLYNVDTCMSQEELQLKIEEIVPQCQVSVEPAGEPVVYPMTNVITCICPSNPTAQTLHAHFDGKTLKQLQIAVEKGKSQKLHVNARLLSAMPDVKDAHLNKKSRVIVRNLSFQAKDADVGGVMSMFGPLTECRIPHVMVEGKTRSRGFAFVTYLFPEDARRVLERCSDDNAKPLHICGREVAVDMAVSKEKFEASKEAEAEAEVDIEADEASEVEEEKEEHHEFDEDEGSMNEQDEEEEDGDDENDDDGDDDDENEDEDGEGDGEEDDEAAGEENEEEEEPEQKIFDVQEGRSVFVRDLPFSITVDQLKETFRPFGRVFSAHIVMDPQSGRPRGSAFVQFDKPASAQTAVDAANSPRGIEVMGRQVVVNLAVDRSRAKTLTSSNTRKTKKDKRNVYLANEGMVAPGSEAAEGVPPIELEKRVSGQADKKKKLVNPLIFVSPVRLSVKNLNWSIDDKALKKLALEAARTGMRRNLVGSEEMNRYHEAQGLSAAQITPEMVSIPQVRYPSVKSAKVMLDLDKKPVNGVYKSKGYGFVEFEHHAHALAFLRELNNNPRYNHLTSRPPQKDSNVISRPMVEFCLEDANKVRILKARANLSKKRVEAMRSQGQSEETKEKESGSERKRGPKGKPQKKKGGAPAQQARGSKRPRQDKQARSSSGDHGAERSGAPSPRGEQKQRKRQRK